MGAHVLHRLSGRRLFGLLLVFPGTGSLPHVFEENVDCEGPVVVRAFLPGNHVAGDAEAAGLGVFQEAAFVVLVVDRDRTALQSAEDLSFHEFFRPRESPVEVDRGDHRLKRIGGDRFLPLSPRVGRARAHQDEIRQVQFSGVAGERFLVDETRSEFGELALLRPRVAPVEVFADDEIQNGVTEELQALVRACGVAGALVEGAVLEGLDEDFVVPDPVSEMALEVAQRFVRDAFDRGPVVSRGSPENSQEPPDRVERAAAASLRSR